MNLFLSRPVLFMSVCGTIVGGTCLLKILLGGSTYQGEPDAKGKTVIVTGANCGIGRETARHLAKRGAKVVMACRDLEKCETARKGIVVGTKNKFVYCRQLDLASQKSIRKFAKGFQEQFDRLDILINNAGVSNCPHSKTAEGIEMQLGVNHMGHFLLTNLLLDKLKASAPSRIVTVTSIAHKKVKINKTDLNSEKNYNASEAYAQSKLANVLFTLELAERLKGTGVTANCVDPGVVDTEIMRHMSYYNSTFSGIFLKPFLWPFTKTPVQGTHSTLFAALDKSLDNVSGSYIKDSSVVETANQGKDVKTALWLWAVSEKWTRSNETDQSVQQPV